MSRQRQKKLRQALEQLELQFAPDRFAQTDPVWFLHSLKKAGAKPLDLEVAGLYASSLAYGGVGVIRRNLKHLFSLTGTHVADFVLKFRPENRGLWDGFSHRFQKGPDLALLTWLLRQTLEKHGSLERAFLLGDSRDTGDIEPGLESLVQELISGDVEAFHSSGELPPRAPVRHLLPAPSAGSACKRMCLYLRWMVRPHFPDLGLWKSVSPGRLVIPLDTHVTRFGQYLGLTARKSPNWKMATELSRALRVFRAEDPVGVDFPLAHLGIHHCRHQWDSQVCGRCPLKDCCSLAKGRKVS